MTSDYSAEVQEVADAMNAVYENKQTNKKNSISGDFSSDNVSYPTVKAVKSEFGSKVTSWSGTVLDTNYPSEKLTKDTLDTKEDVNNKVTSWSNTVTDGHYPSEKLVKDNLDTKENLNNKVTNWNSTPTDTNYPSEKLTKDTLDTKEILDNKVSSWSNTVTDVHYPTEKLVKDNLDTKENLSNKVTSWSGTLSDDNYPSEKLVKNTIDTKTITVEKQVTAESGYASTYVIKQNGSQVGVKINIDKDRMLRSASYETVGSTPTTEESNANMTTGDKYIKLVVNTADSDSASNLILPITDIFDLQTADNTTLTLTNGVYAIKTGGVDTAQLKDGAVTSDKIASAVKNSWLSTSDVQSEISAFASALAEAINPSSP